MSYWRRVIRRKEVELGNEAWKAYGRNQSKEYYDCEMCEKSFL